MSPRVLVALARLATPAIAPLRRGLSHTESDVISDVNKIYRSGFIERMDSAGSLIAALDSLKQKRVLP